MTGFYRELNIKDTYPLNILYPRLLILLQDFVAPFWIFVRPEFNLEYKEFQDDFSSVKVVIGSSSTIKIGRWETRKIESEFILTGKGIEEFIIFEKNREIHAKRIVHD